MADDMQNIPIRQVMGPKQVNESEMDSLFDEIDRIREQYIKLGSKEGPRERQMGSSRHATKLARQSGANIGSGIKTGRISGGYL